MFFLLVCLFRLVVRMRRVCFVLCVSVSFRFFLVWCWLSCCLIGCLLCRFLMLVVRCGV